MLLSLIAIIGIVLLQLLSSMILKYQQNH